MDLFRDFAYAKVTGTVPASNANDVLVVAVDDASRLPSNAELGSAEFWMTLESDLVTGAFEIVRVLSRTSTTVTLLRGQDGTGAYAHPAGTYLKASITAASLRRLAMYRRYVDLGNVALRGVAQCANQLTRIFGASAGAANGSSVVAGVAVNRKVSGGAGAGAGVTAAALVERLGLTLDPRLTSISTVSAVLRMQRRIAATVTDVGTAAGALAMKRGLLSAAGGVSGPNSLKSDTRIAASSAGRSVSAAGGISPKTLAAGSTAGRPTAISSPTQVSGLSLWLDVDSVTDADGALLASTIPDASSSGHTGAAFTGRAPTVRKTIVNGRAALDFAGAQAISGALSTWGTSDFTIFQVFYPRQFGGANTYYGTSQDLFNTEMPTSLNDFGTAIGTKNFLAGTGNPDVFATSGATLPMNTWHIAIVERTKSSGLLRTFVDDATSVLASITGSTATLNANTSWYIGGANESGTWEAGFNGLYATCLVFNRVLTDIERQDVLNWLYNRYFVASSVAGGTHVTGKVALRAAVASPVAGAYSYSASDNFNRPDSATSLGAPSDLGPLWVQDGTDFGISGSTAYAASVSTTGTFGGSTTARAMRKVGPGGSDIVDCTIKNTRVSAAGASYIIIDADASGANLLYWQYDSSSSYRFLNFNGSAMTLTPTGSYAAWTSSSGASTTLRFVWNRKTGAAVIYQNGVSVFTATTGIPTWAGGWSGFATANAGQDFWDDHSVVNSGVALGVPGTATVTGNLKNLGQSVTNAAFLDNFNRTDRDLFGDNGWSAKSAATGWANAAGSGVTISGGTVVATQWSQIYRTAHGIGVADYEMSMAIASDSTANGAFFTIATATGGIFYTVCIDYVSAGTIRIRLYTGTNTTSRTTILADSGNISGTRSATWRFTWDGATLRVRANGTTVFLASTSITMSASAASPRFFLDFYPGMVMDNFIDHTYETTGRATVAGALS